MLLVNCVCYVLPFKVYILKLSLNFSCKCSKDLQKAADYSNSNYFSINLSNRIKISHDAFRCVTDHCVWPIKDE